MEEKKSRVEDENQSDGRRKRKKRRESGEKYIYIFRRENKVKARWRGLWPINKIAVLNQTGFNSFTYIIILILNKRLKV